MNMSEVERFIRNLKISAALISIEGSLDEKELQRQMDKLSYDIDMYEPEKVIERVVGKREKKSGESR
jgi:hypothetical protein